ncbi:hypothetical protein PLICRDRAFT_43861 [Plicaturopsis crispa FD-325 SS-3]|nr:hypothetical protein PLICRDRAFT_43861 [Plicaturopsis crispa FD-325 SS-3]
MLGLRYNPCKQHLTSALGAFYHSGSPTKLFSQSKPVILRRAKDKMSRLRYSPDLDDKDLQLPPEKKPRLELSASPVPPAESGSHTETEAKIDGMLDVLVSSERKAVARRSRSSSPDAPADPTATNPLQGIRPSRTDGAEKKTGKSKKAKNKKVRHNIPEPCSTEDVLWRDIVAVLGQEAVDEASKTEGLMWDSPYAFHDEVECEVSELSSNGEGLAVPVEGTRPWVIVVPFALPGERIRARIYRNDRMHSRGDLVSVDTPNPALRDDSRVACKYFGQCAGCQYQMLSYEQQLDIKQNVVVKAFRNFSGLPESSVPTVLPTIPSPKQLNYRTKLTPHFEAPSKKHLKNGGTQSGGDDKTHRAWLKIGFNRIGTRNAMDIEECPIGTPVLNEKYNSLRVQIHKDIYKYKKGVSLLLRDSLEIPSTNSEPPTTIEADSDSSLASSFEKHVCVTDHKAIVRERVGDKIFEFPGGSFFQNNNSILVPLTTYVRDAIFPPTSSSSPPPPRLTHLIDAYCGSGLFAITLSEHFDTIAGIELSADSIKYAKHNAQLNGIPEGKCSFRAGDAAHLFTTVQDFPPEQSVLIIDPPRKGCDESFINQLLAFKAKTVVYVSCNVHTQARDIGMILNRGTEGGGEGGRYVLESLRGFDLYPQTAHVESVAVLRLV